ncbi:MAG: hypothetical protein BMS9Abin30_0753 [Gammaproteobacteria bacterium]|nr:MAG: hypothetical protein BMS9Abin30_0753 [Gammaproteobacteria bacterium]
MCGKAAVSHLAWKDVYAWATSLTPPVTLPANPADRINISPSRSRRKSEPDSMVWETLPVSWFYEFDSRVRPQVPYAVFPLHAPFWLLCGLASRFTTTGGSQKLSISIITVAPNEVLKSVGHHRSPAIIRSADEAAQWLRAPKAEALDLLRPFPNQSMGVDVVPMGIKIPGNEKILMPECLSNLSGFRAMSQSIG